MPRTVDDYLDAARARLRLPSDRQLAKKLEITPTSLNGWRSKRAWPADAQMVRLAQLAGLDPDLALIDLNTWRAKGTDAQAGYARLREIVAKASAAALAIMVVAATPDANAGTEAAQINIERAVSIHYARFRNWLKSLAFALKTRIRNELAADLS